MKKIFLVLLTVAILGISCKSTQKTAQTQNSLEGLWQLNYISGPRISFDGLYATTVPSVTFDLKENKFSGTNSCNRFSGSFTLNKNKIKFDNDKTAITMMACQGNGDKVFMSTLQKIDSYELTEDGQTLQFFVGDVAMMRFEKMNVK